MVLLGMIVSLGQVRDEGVLLIGDLIDVSLHQREDVKGTGTDRKL